MTGSAERLLLTSIHDVGPGFQGEIEDLATLIEKRLGGPKFAMLVVPDHWGENPLRGNREFGRRLHNWSSAGIEMFVHGWFHKDEAVHKGLTAVKARVMTASEGEFLPLAQAEAARRMEDGRKLIEDIIGRQVAGFVAPAWLYGPGAKSALQQTDFSLAEDHLRVWIPQTGEVVARGPVVTWASRSKLRTASSLTFAAIARTALQPLRTVRVAVHPGDVTKPEILASIDKTLAAFAAKRVPARYADLLNQ